MGQLERYGLYVLVLVICLILGVAIWGDDPGAPRPGEGPGVADAGEEGLPFDRVPAVPPSQEDPQIEALLRQLDQGRGQPPGRNVSQVPSEQPAQQRAVEASVPPGEPREYTVKDGDSPWKIAKRELGLSDDGEAHRATQRIAELNPGVDPKKIRPGDVIRIPPRSLSMGSGTEEDPGGGNGVEGRICKVRKGEDLWRIVKRVYGLTDEQKRDIWRVVEMIKDLNPDVGDWGKLMPNDQIRIPLVQEVH